MPVRSLPGGTRPPRRRSPPPSCRRRAVTCRPGARRRTAAPRSPGEVFSSRKAGSSLSPSGVGLVAVTGKRQHGEAALGPGAVWAPWARCPAPAPEHRGLSASRVAHLRGELLPPPRADGRAGLARGSLPPRSAGAEARRGDLSPREGRERQYVESFKQVMATGPAGSERGRHLHSIAEPAASATPERFPCLRV